MYRDREILRKETYIQQQQFLVFNEHLLYMSKRGLTKVQVGTMGPLPHYQKVALKEPPTNSKNVGQRESFSLT
jgi:hypothetical protein